MLGPILPSLLVQNDPNMQDRSMPYSIGLFFLHVCQNSEQSV